jgi:hypothetical protein
MFTFNYNSQIKPDFKPLESLIHKNILNHIGRDEPRSRRTEIGGTARGSLHTHTTNNQQRFSGISFLEDEREEGQTDGSKVQPRDTRSSSGG